MKHKYRDFWNRFTYIIKIWKLMRDDDAFRIRLRGIFTISINSILKIHLTSGDVLTLYSEYDKILRDHNQRRFVKWFHGKNDKHFSFCGYGPNGKKSSVSVARDYIIRYVIEEQ
jgi:hypothetical protein